MINIKGFLPKSYKKDIINVVNEIMIDSRQPIDDIEINIYIVSNRVIRRLNSEYRGIDRVTDVLTFPAIDVSVGEVIDINTHPMEIDIDTNKLLLGEIFISKSVAKMQAKQYGHNLHREIAFLATHGCLHLLGYDHIEEDQRIVMENKQKIILDSLNIHR